MFLGRLRMNEYLVFCLIAPMGSFGGYSGHEKRNTDIFPLRSTIIGLLGAALGVCRTDLELQKNLLDYKFAVRALAEGSSFRDFHTVQSIPSTVRNPNSRKEAIKRIGNKAKTTITKRDYRTDIAFSIAVWSSSGFWALPDLAHALNFPKYILYVGRKSCPLAAPMDPKIVIAHNPIESLHGVQRSDKEPSTELFPIISDPFPGGEPNRKELVPSEPIDRILWHFEQRERWYFDK